MPDYHPCVMIVSGNISRWAKQLNTADHNGAIQEFSLHHHVPVGTRPLRGPGLFDVGQSHLWGTKWDACDVEVKYVNLDKGVARVDFSTAWCIPHMYFLLASKLYPECEFKVVFEGSSDDVAAGVIAIYKNMNYENKWVIKADRKEGTSYCDCYDEIIDGGGESAIEEGVICENCDKERIGDDLMMFHLDWELGSIY